MESVAVRNLGKSYPVAGGAVDALRHLDLVIERGECVTLLGPSGCGKSTLLRVIAGLVQGYDGEVVVEGTPIIGTGAERGMVFQVLLDRDIGIQRARLEHHAELAQRRACLTSDIVTEDPDLARPDRIEPRYQGKQRRLSGTVHAQQHHERRRPNRQADIVQRDPRTITMADAIDGKGRDAINGERRRLDGIEWRHAGHSRHTALWGSISAFSPLRSLRQACDMRERPTLRPKANPGFAALWDPNLTSIVDPDKILEGAARLPRSTCKPKTP